MPPTRSLSYMLNGGIAAPSYRNISYPSIAPQSTFDYGGAGTHTYYPGPQQQQQMMQDLLAYEGPLQQQQQPAEYTHSYATPHQLQQRYQYQHPLPQQTWWQQQQAAYIHPYPSPHQLQSMYQHSQLHQGQWQQQPAECVNPSNWRHQSLPEYGNQPLQEIAQPQVLMPQESTPAPQEPTPSQEPIPPQELTSHQVQMSPRPWRNQGVSENPVLGSAPQIATTSAPTLSTVIPTGSASAFMRKSKFISMNAAVEKPKKPRAKRQSTGTAGKRTNKKRKNPGKFRCSGPDPECLKQTFRTITDLNRHLKHSVKHVPPRFRCYYPECSQSTSNHYVRSDSLLRHLRVDHPDDPYVPEIGRQLAAEAATQFRAQAAGMTPDF